MFGGKISKPFLFFSGFQCHIQRNQLCFGSFFLRIVAKLRMNLCKGSVWQFVVQIYWLFSTVSITHSPQFTDSEAFFVCNFDSIHLALNSFYHIECPLRLNMDAPEWKTINFRSVRQLYRKFQFYRLVLLIENRTWPYVECYLSCFVEVWISSSLHQELSVSKDRSAWVDTSNNDLIG